MKTNYRLLMGGTALLVSLFLNFRYAYGGYGASAQFSPGVSLRSVAVPDKNPDDDTDTDTECGTALNGQPYVCDSKTDIVHDVGSCTFYVVVYEYSKKKNYDVLHEGERDEYGNIIKVKLDREYDDWKVVGSFRNADISKVTEDNLPPGVFCNKNNVQIGTDIVAGTMYRVDCLEGGEDKCLPVEERVTCAEESDSNVGY